MKIKIGLVIALLLSGLQIHAMTDDTAGTEAADGDVTALSQSSESDGSESTPSSNVSSTAQETVAPTESGPVPTEPVMTEAVVEEEVVTSEPEVAPIAPEVISETKTVSMPTETMPVATEQISETTNIPASTETSAIAEVPAPTTPTVTQPVSTNLQPVSGSQPTVPSDEEQEEGIIDTMEIDDNVNWLEVRKYLQDATTLLEKIGVAYGQVSDMRMQYFQKRNQADKQFDDFMQAAGIDLGELIQKTNDYIQRVQSERAADGDLSQKERDFLDALTKNKETLDQLQQDLLSLAALDASIDDILTTAEQQISNSRNYQTQAWQSFQKLETTPQNAEGLYAKIDAAYQNVNQLYAYLQGALLQHFNDVISTLNTQITTINNEINTLKTAGINLTSSMKDFEAEEALEDQQAAAARCAQQSAEAVEAALEEARQQRELLQSQSWIGKIKGFGSWIVDSIGSVFSWVKGLVGFGGSKTTASESDTDVIETPAPTAIPSTSSNGTNTPQATGTKAPSATIPATTNGSASAVQGAQPVSKMTPSPNSITPPVTTQSTGN